MPAGRRAVFLDLNGTLVLPVRDADPSDLKPIPGAIEAVRRLNSAGYRTPVITVQSRIARRAFTEAEFRDWFAEFQSEWRHQGAFIEGPYVCPHDENDGCRCRKPGTALYLRAIADIGVEPQRSYVVGDTSADVRAGTAIGATTCLVRTGSGEYSLRTDPVAADFIGADVAEASDWIIGRYGGAQ